MSILFRSKMWLTVDQLLPAWAAELPGADRDPAGIRRDLEHYLLEDMINSRLDESGPIVDGCRFGLRLITPEGRGGFIGAREIRDLTASHNTPQTRSWLWSRVVIRKEAILDFASRHQLPAPSWWPDAKGTEHTSNANLSERQASGSGQLNRVLEPKVATRLRGPKPKKLQQVKEAMKADVQRGRYTAASLNAMVEKELADIYGVSRDTVRKARNAVVSEIAENSIRDK